MKIIKTLLFFIFFVISSSYLFADWFQQTSGTTYDLNSVKFLDSNTGWIFGGSSNGVILKTTNSGINWNIQFNIYNYHLLSGSFIDANTGWAVGANVIDLTSKIIKTTNSGVNWLTQFTVLNDLLTSIFFVNNNTGWAIGGNLLNNVDKIYKTTNGGINWFTQSYNDTLALRTIFFINSNTGWIGGFGNKPGTYGILLKTTNSGINWLKKLQLNTNPSVISSVQFIDAFTGWIVDGLKTLMKSTNSGDNWFNLNNSYQLKKINVFFVDANTGWIVGANNFNVPASIIKSTNGGLDWIIQYYTPNILWFVYFPNKNTGWAVGSNGLILKTTNGGNPIGIKPISSEVPNSFILHQNYPNPFNPVTIIKYDLAKNSKVKITIYNILGQQVKILVNELKKAGSYDVKFDATNLASSVYFYRIEAGTFIEAKKMVLVK